MYKVGKLLKSIQQGVQVGLPLSSQFISNVLLVCKGVIPFNLFWKSCSTHEVFSAKVNAWSVGKKYTGTHLKITLVSVLPSAYLLHICGFCKCLSDNINTCAIVTHD